jgi:hypothetical protein
MDPAASDLALEAAFRSDAGSTTGAFHDDTPRSARWRSPARIALAEIRFLYVPMK